MHFFVLHMQADICKQDFMEERKDREAKHSQLEYVKESSAHAIGKLENTIRYLKRTQPNQLTQSCEYERPRRGKGRSGQLYSVSSDTLDDHHGQKEMVMTMHRGNSCMPELTTIICMHCKLANTCMQLASLLDAVSYTNE